MNIDDLAEEDLAVIKELFEKHPLIKSTISTTLNEICIRYKYDDISLEDFVNRLFCMAMASTVRLYKDGILK